MEKIAIKSRVLCYDWRNKILETINEWMDTHGWARAKHMSRFTYSSSRFTGILVHNYGGQEAIWWKNNVLNELMNEWMNESR